MLAQTMNFLSYSTDDLLIRIYFISTVQVSYRSKENNRAINFYNICELFFIIYSSKASNSLISNMWYLTISSYLAVVMERLARSPFYDLHLV